MIGRGSKVGVRVRCPRGSDLVLRGSSADLDAVGALGAVDVKTTSGDVSLEDAVALTADTASGDVRVRDVETTLRSAYRIRRCDGSPLRGRLSANLVSGDLASTRRPPGWR